MSRYIVHIPADWPHNPLLHWHQIDTKGVIHSQSGANPPPDWGKDPAVILLLPASQTLLLAVQLPAGGRQQALAALPYLVEEQLSCDADKVHVALGARLGDGRHLAAVIDPDWLNPLLAQCANWQLRARMAIPEALLLPGSAEAWHIDWQGREGSLCGASALPQILDSGSAEQPPQSLQWALAEAQQQGRAPEQIHLHLRDGADDIHPQRWSEALGLALQVHNDNPFIQPKLAYHSQLNLLQGAFAPASPFSALQPMLKPALVILALMLLLQVSASLAQWWMLKKEATQLRADMEQTFRSTFPEARSVVDPVLQMQRQINSLQQQRGSPEADDFLVLLNQAAALIKPSTLRSLDYRDHALHLALRCPDRATLEKLLTQLKQQRLRVELTHSQQRDSDIEAQITLRAADT